MRGLLQLNEFQSQSFLLETTPECISPQPDLVLTIKIGGNIGWNTVPAGSAANYFISRVGRLHVMQELQGRSHPVLADVAIRHIPGTSNR